MLSRCNVFLYLHVSVYISYVPNGLYRLCLDLLARSFHSSYHMGPWWSKISLLQHLSERWDRMMEDYYIHRWLECSSLAWTKRAWSSQRSFHCTVDLPFDYMYVIAPFKETIFLQVRRLPTRFTDDGCWNCCGEDRHGRFFIAADSLVGPRQAPSKSSRGRTIFV